MSALARSLPQSAGRSWKYTDRVGGEIAAWKRANGSRLHVSVCVTNSVLGTSHPGFNHFNAQDLVRVPAVLVKSIFPSSVVCIIIFFSLQ